MRAPSKKISVVFLVTAIIVTSIILINKIGDNKKTNTLSGGSRLNTKLTADLQDKLQDDSDSDGLMDWEESLWQTDPNNSDTDGDGTNDGKEISENRNPSLNSENDLLKDTNERILEIIESNENQPAGLTKNFSDDLIKNYFYLRSENKSELTQQQQKDLINDLVNEVVNKKKIKNKYNESSLVVFDDSLDKVGLLNYANNLILIEKRAQEIFKQNPNGTTNDYFRLEEKIANDLISERTPIRMATTQTILANNYYNAGLSMLWMEEKNDPILQLLGISLFSQSTETISENWSIIIQYLKNNDIIYDGNVFILNENY